MSDIQAALVKTILGSWKSYEWTIQGFGFARTKIADVGRIHIWDSRLSVPLVSTAHTHPWPLNSTIISGELINQRFVVSETGWLPYMESDIKTGEGGGLSGDPRSVLLESKPPETYTAGQRYRQAPEEVHRTIAQDGTVTLLERPQGPPLEQALTYWPAGMSWVSAEPRPPKNEWELQPIIALALARWSASTSAKDAK